ncbi:hypothetical protein [Gordonia sp. (in: high G+C Gram-positive bacteria)]|uniref:hypothetical protein n=1 Tax=Gordonia sp. (in: high G+C Gram-positive bacteria) TaxID=84139 RepID=UPI0039E55F7C
MLDRYEKIVAESDEGIAVKESRDRAATAYEEAIRRGELVRPDEDLYAEGLALYDRVVRPRRRGRTSALHNDVQTIVEALSGATILGADDPILNVAYPLGTPDGRDKVLAKWTAEDWRNATLTRYRNAAETTAAAQIFAEQSRVHLGQLARARHRLGNRRPVPSHSAEDRLESNALRRAATRTGRMRTWKESHE